MRTLLNRLLFIFSAVCITFSYSRGAESLKRKRKKKNKTSDQCIANVFQSQIYSKSDRFPGKMRHFLRFFYTWIEKIKENCLSFAAHCKIGHFLHLFV